MKRFFLLTIFCSIVSFGAYAQDNTAAPSPAELDEKLKRLNSDVDTLLAANSKLQKEISSLRDEIANLHEQQAKAANDSSLQSLRDDLRKLAEKVQEVDKKRLDDREVVTEQLDRIEKALKIAASSATAPRPTARPPRTETTPAPVPTGPGFEYVVKSGDTVSEIVSSANAQFKEQGMKSVTLQQVLDANPGLNPNKMRVGQKIFIPAPGK